MFSLDSVTKIIVFTVKRLEPAMFIDLPVYCKQTNKQSWVPKAGV